MNVADQTDLLARLSQHRTIGEAPQSELEWLVAHGSLRQFTAGEVVARRGGPALSALWVVLSGHLAIYVDRGLGPRKAFEWKGGDVSGFLPYSRLAKVPGDVKVLEDGECFTLDREYFPELIRDCPGVTTALVHTMLDRARAFTSSDLQDEKMISLGRISAGLAHELNNPASAAVRSAQLLVTAQGQAEESARLLALAHLTQPQLDLLDAMRQDCKRPAATQTPIERADREEVLTEWLETHEIDSEMAAPLLDTAVTIEELDRVAAAVRGADLDVALRWVASSCTVRILAGDIEKAASRVHTLEAAVKRSTYMDRSQTAEAIDLSEGLSDAITLLQHKARAKSAQIVLALAPGLPMVKAIGSDLGQIWMNLIDNALDAVGEGGRVDIGAGARQHGFVVVHVVDNGSGIPEDIKGRIFDPFFTTKPVGQGTGLGLDLVQRLIRRNGGDVEFESVPGRTEFRVSLPIAAEAAAR
jgi:signal transduction histidine kinase